MMSLRIIGTSGSIFLSLFFPIIRNNQCYESCIPESNEELRIEEAEL